MSTSTGGPAFPGTQYASEISPSGHSVGMTLRDYFAAKAMPAVYRDFWDDVRAGRHDCVTEDWRIGLAVDAYAMADAMLDAREK